MNHTVNKLHPSAINKFNDMLKSDIMPYIFYAFSSPDTKNFTNSPIDAVIVQGLHITHGR